MPFRDDHDQPAEKHDRDHKGEETRGGQSFRDKLIVVVRNRQMMPGRKPEKLKRPEHAAVQGCAEEDDRVIQRKQLCFKRGAHLNTPPVLMGFSSSTGTGGASHSCPWP